MKGWILPVNIKAKQSVIMNGEKIISSHSTEKQLRKGMETSF